MTDLFRLSGATAKDPLVEAWFASGHDELRSMVKPWFERMRDLGPDVLELLHDGRPTACVRDAAFGYVDAFTTHASVGFFNGSLLHDPAHLLEGSGRHMRHVKLRWGRPFDAAALEELIAASCRDIRRRLEAGG